MSWCWAKEEETINKRYEKLDVQFDGQVVATFKGSTPSIIDTAKAKEVYDKLVAADKQSADTASPVNAVAMPVVSKDTVVKPKASVVPPRKPAVGNNKTVPAATANRTSVVATNKPIVTKTTVIKAVTTLHQAQQQIKQPIIKSATNKLVEKKLPKAVLKKSA